MFLIDGKFKNDDLLKDSGRLSIQISKTTLIQLLINLYSCISMRTNIRNASEDLFELQKNAHLIGP